MQDCIFCKIVAGEIPSDKVYEDDKIIAFSDIAPVAPVHILIIPKKHTENIVTAEKELVAYMIKKVGEIAGKMGLEKDGFRLVTNKGLKAGQTVNHLHFHLIGGKELGWPPC